MKSKRKRGDQTSSLSRYEKESDVNLMRIDKLKLDEEWIAHPAMVQEYAEKQAVAQNKFDRAKYKLELTEAELDTKIRADPAAYGVPKLTEKVVEKTILLHPQYQEDMEAYLDAKADLESYKAVIASFSHRKAALENTANLWMCSYFSGPRTSTTNREMLEKMERKKTRSKGVKRRE